MFRQLSPRGQEGGERCSERRVPDQTRQAVLTPSLPTLQHIYFGLAVDTLSFLGTQIPETIHLITFTSKRLL